MAISNASRNKTLIVVAAVLIALVLCVCLLGGLGLAGYFFYQQRVTVTAEPAVEYVLDASPRMSLAIEGGTRLEIARAVLAEVVRPADASVAAGLRDFGSGADSTPCADTNLLVPLATANQTQIAATAFSLQVGDSSDSALAEAMLAAIKDLAAVKGPHTLVVITGGADSCNAQAGELLKQEAARAGIKLQEFVIGFAVTPDDSQAIKGLIDGSDGTYFDAPDADTLHNILLTIQSHIDQPSSTSLATIQTAATPGAIVNLPTPSTSGGAFPTQSEPTAGAAATSVPTDGFVGQTACDHPYLPLRPGATWTYASSEGQEVWTVASVAGDRQNAVAVVNITLNDTTITYNWNCSIEGIRFFQSVGISTPELSQELTISDESGVALLGADRLIPGASWNYAYTMTISSTVNGANFAFNNSISSNNTAGDIQTLDTSFGTVDVVTINGSDTATISSDLIPSTTSTSTHVWQFGKGIGLIKFEGTYEGGSNSSELVSYSIP